MTHPKSIQIAQKVYKSSHQNQKFHVSIKYFYLIAKEWATKNEMAVNVVVYSISCPMLAAKFQSLLSSVNTK